MLAGLFVGSLSLPVGIASASSPSRVAEPERPPSEEEVTEYQIKAAYLLNFIRFTSFPKEVLGPPEKPLTILVVGRNPFGKILEEFFQKKDAHGRKLVVRYAAAVPDELDANVVFMKDLSDDARDELIKGCTARSVLLVGDHDGLAALGACVSFYIEKRKVRFEINTDVLKRSKLSASSELLKLAKIVKDKSGDRPGAPAEHSASPPESSRSADRQLRPLPSPQVSLPSETRDTPAHPQGNALDPTMDDQSWPLDPRA